ncbi:MAG: thiamine phosphate synthase [Candidatus Omnitrophica bacterium]|nr:thiamine phosphate synthase [Candidatus Omnitrophota bacterium]
MSINRIFRQALYVVLDIDLPYLRKDPLSLAEDLLRGGVDILQLRSKFSPGKYLFALGKKIKKIVRKNKAIFIINDRVDIAKIVEADGVHLGQEDLPVDFARNMLGKDKIIGLSTHNLAQARRAQRSEIDYISVGPVFKSPTKPELKPIGIEGLKKIVKISRLPVVAIGGINPDNLPEVLGCGVDSVAVISSILKSKDIVERVKVFKQLLSYGY